MQIGKTSIGLACLRGWGADKRRPVAVCQGAFLPMEWNLQQIPGTGQTLDYKQEGGQDINSHVDAPPAKIAQDFRLGSQGKQHQTHNGDTCPVVRLPELNLEWIVAEAENFRLTAKGDNTCPRDKGKAKAQGLGFDLTQRDQGNDRPQKYKAEFKNPADSTWKLLNGYLGGNHHGEGNEG